MTSLFDVIITCHRSRSTPTHTHALIRNTLDGCIYKEPQTPNKAFLCALQFYFYPWLNVCSFSIPLALLTKGWGKSDPCLTLSLSLCKEKNPERVAAGLKATVHNAKTSEDTKRNAARRLDDMGVEIEQQGSTRKAGTGAPATGEFGRGAYTSVDYTNDPKEADIGKSLH